MHAEVKSRNKPCELPVTHQPQQTPKTPTLVTGSSLTMTEPFQNEATTEWPLKVWTRPNRSLTGPAEIPTEKEKKKPTKTQRPHLLWLKSSYAIFLHLVHPSPILLWEIKVRNHHLWYSSGKDGKSGDALGNSCLQIRHFISCFSVHHLLFQSS